MPLATSCQAAPGGFTLTMICQDVGTDTIEVAGETSGMDFGDQHVGFNPHYMLELMKDVPTDRLTLDLVDAQKPAVVRGDHGTMRLLMPVRCS